MSIKLSYSGGTPSLKGFKSGKTLKTKFDVIHYSHDVQWSGFFNVVISF